MTGKGGHPTQLGLLLESLLCIPWLFLHALPTPPSVWLQRESRCLHGLHLPHPLILWAQERAGASSQPLFQQDPLKAHKIRVAIKKPKVQPAGRGELVGQVAGLGRAWTDGEEDFSRALCAHQPCSRAFGRDGTTDRRGNSDPLPAERAMGSKVLVTALTTGRAGQCLGYRVQTWLNPLRTLSDAVIPT